VTLAPDSAMPLVEYDLAGLVRLHVVGARGGEMAALRAQLDTAPTAPRGSPDLVVRFVERLEHGRLTALGGDSASSDEGFFVVDPHRGKRARIPFEAIGAQPELVVERGSRKVPLLEPIINLTLLAKGGLALHASAFGLSGVGSVVAGWPRGGKTTVLLAFAAHGGRIVADDWTYLEADSRSLHGAVERLHLSERHLRGLDMTRARLTRGERLRLRTEAGVRSFSGLLEDRPRSGSTAARTLRATAEGLAERLEVTATAERLFGDTGVGDAVSLDRIFLVLVSPARAVTVKRTDERTLARRLVCMLQVERAQFLEHYAKFGFAFPEARNALVEQATELELERLGAAVAHRPAYTVHHPEGADGPALVRAMRRYCD
jgi:hypothetical protein